MANAPWLVVVAGLAVRDETILLTQRLPGKHLAGCWEFPGGKLEPGETPERALARELEEEIGVAAKVGRLLDAVSHAYEKFTVLMLLYHVEFAGEAKTLEVAAARWVTPQEIAALPLPPADEPLVARLTDYMTVVKTHV